MSLGLERLIEGKVEIANALTFSAALREHTQSATGQKRIAQGWGIWRTDASLAGSIPIVIKTTIFGDIGKATTYFMTPREAASDTVEEWLHLDLGS